jgi:enoyl-CoA hydratase/carnithine racemase
LVLGCDLLWAAEDARFGLVETTVGLTPGGGGTQRLAARAGIARATEIVFTGGIYPATDFERWGIVNRLRPADTLLAEARAFVDTLAAGPTVALAAGKKILRAARISGVEAADDITPVQSGLVFETEDIVAGITAVLAKKPGTATFAGR